jgi:hypothetical protein
VAQGNERKKGIVGDMMTKRYGIVWLSAMLAIPLWREFHEPNNMLWNVFLATFLVAVVMGAFFGLRYLDQHQDAVGEAKFKSPRKEADGN